MEQDGGWNGEEVGCDGGAESRRPSPWTFKLTGHPLGNRTFPGMAPAQEFMAANPAAMGQISRLDKLPDVRPI